MFSAAKAELMSLSILMTHNIFYTGFIGTGPSAEHSYGPQTAHKKFSDNHVLISLKQSFKLCSELLFVTFTGK